MNQKYGLTAQLYPGLHPKQHGSGHGQEIQMAMCKSKQPSPGSCLSVDQSILGKERSMEK